MSILANPAVLVNGSPPVYSATAGQAMTITLVNPAGVSSLAVTVIGTDKSGPTVPTIITNNSTLTASFTMTGTYTGLLMKCVVNNNLDATGVFNPALATTFKVYVPDGYGNQPVAVGERLEGGPYGWLYALGEGSFSASGDLGGSPNSQVVKGIQGIPVSATAPTSNQVLEYNGTQYVPVTLSAGFAAGGDLSGSSTSQTVKGIQTVAVASTAPTTGQVLEYNGTQWAPTTIATGAAGWVTALDLDFTTQSTQTMSSNTTYTIGGLTWTKENSANDLTAMKITNGTGLQVNPNQSTSYYSGSRTAPLIRLPISSVSASIDWGCRVRIYVSIGAISGSGFSGSNVYSFCGIDSDNTNYMSSFSFGSRGGTGGWNYELAVGGAQVDSNAFGQQPSGFYAPTQANDGCFMFEFAAVCQSPVRGFVHTGLSAGTSFPGLSGYTPLGVAPGANVSSMMQAVANRPYISNLGLTVGAATATSTSLTIIIQRVRVDYNNS